MPNKCCVPHCSSNYRQNKENYVSLYRFPKEEFVFKAWKHIIPRANLKIITNTVVCRKHWPKDAKFVKQRNGECPVDPPSIFPDTIPKSCLSTNLPEKCTTVHALSCDIIRTDKLDVFNKKDIINYSTLLSENHQQE